MTMFLVIPRVVLSTLPDLEDPKRLVIGVISPSTKRMGLTPTLTMAA